METVSSPLPTTARLHHSLPEYMATAVGRSITGSTPRYRRFTPPAATCCRSAVHIVAFTPRFSWLCVFTTSTGLTTSASWKARAE